MVACREGISQSYNIVMGAPKHKWSQEEESALRSAVAKHGPGRWRTILKDPDFSQVLFLRSNVDLKDKWRNISVMGYGSGSRPKPVKRTLGSLPSDEEILEMVDAKNFSTTGSSALQASSPRTPNWLDSLITEAICTMKQPGGSSKTAIGNYIQERYEVPPNFKQLLSSKLKYLSAFGSGKLIKVKRKYRIPNSTALSSHKKRHLGTSSDKDEVSVQRQSEVDGELARMMIVNIHEAAAIAAQAVAEAEAAMAEADEAAKQAEIAEAEAEAAQVFAEEVSKSLKGIKQLQCADDPYLR
uniref:MYB transcription factor n=2 Tax=Brassica campestris TaxID=3711 RepID=A0A3P6BMZ2_BRACM|nr:unnamed protein product [Brassica rapa]